MVKFVCLVYSFCFVCYVFVLWGYFFFAFWLTVKCLVLCLLCCVMVSLFLCCRRTLFCVVFYFVLHFGSSCFALCAFAFVFLCIFVHFSASVMKITLTPNAQFFYQSYFNNKKLSNYNLNLLISETSVSCSPAGAHLFLKFYQMHVTAGKNKHKVNIVSSDNLFL